MRDDRAKPNAGAARFQPVAAEDRVSRLAIYGKRTLIEAAPAEKTIEAGTGSSVRCPDPLEMEHHERKPETHILHCRWTRRRGTGCLCRLSQRHLRAGAKAGKPGSDR